MRVLLLAPAYNNDVPGESWSTYKWVQGISARFETVVLTQHRTPWDPSRSPVAAAQVVNWDEPQFPGMTGRLAWELNPAYVFFYHRARRWLKQAKRRGEHFDLVHQINPLALRYPCPARGLGYKYVIGPLAGSLQTPPALRATTPERQWYRKLRNLDAFRLRHDPWLRDSYSGAAALIGVAPYVGELLSHCPPPRFEIMAETGIDEVASAPKPAREPGRPLRLVFVGRLIATKGIIEAIEAVGMASRQCSVTLDVVGAGDLAGQCAELVARLGLGEIVRLHGRQSRDEVFRWYDRSDVFLFPSYREPSGNVVFEAMSRGLPVITSTIGGPGYVVTDACGCLIAPETRAGFVTGLSDAIIRLASQPATLGEMSAAALRRMREIATWPEKHAALAALYLELAGASPGNAPRNPVNPRG